MYHSSSREIKLPRGRVKRRSKWRGSVRLGLLFATLVIINIYVFFLRGGTSINDILKTSAIASKAASSHLAPALSSSKASNTASMPNDSVVIHGTMKGSLGLANALAGHNLGIRKINELTTALSAELNLRTLRPEHTFELHLDPKTNDVRKFIYRLSPISTVEVIRTSQGLYKTRKQEATLTPKIVEFGGSIESSLNHAISKAGETGALVATFVDLFSWDINWYADPREGDEFRIVVEKLFHGDKFYRYGKILAAEYSGKVGHFQAFYFNPKNGQAGYYTPEGRSIRRPFLKTPLNFRRLSSKFNMHRFHPVLHTTKGHFGVDYAAPAGTPVWAASDGTVASASFSKGAGNMVVLSHAGGIATIYMHLLRFAPKLRAGLKVKQHQLIGYVGSTGLSTGPHLHYGLRKHGQYIDPLKFDPPRGELLPQADRLRFMEQLPKQIAMLQRIPTQEIATNKE